MYREKEEGNGFTAMKSDVFVKSTVIKIYAAMNYKFCVHAQLYHYNMRIFSPTPSNYKCIFNKQI